MVLDRTVVQSEIVVQDWIVVAFVQNEFVVVQTAIRERTVSQYEAVVQSEVAVA